jgi:hypothetical protein
MAHNNWISFVYMYRKTLTVVNNLKGSLRDELFNRQDILEPANAFTPSFFSKPPRPPVATPRIVLIAGRACVGTAEVCK